MNDTVLTDPAHIAVADAPAPLLPRKRTVQLGTAMMTAATAMYFGGLFAIYVGARSAHLASQADAEKAIPWIPSSATVELSAPTIMAWTLIISVVTMQWAVYSFKRDDRRHALLGLGVTAIFGIAVINQVSFQWNQLGLVADDISTTAAAPLIYAITGSHVALIVVALGFFLFAAFRAMASSSLTAHLDIAASAAVLWYAAVAIYFVIWILIFITK